MEPFGPDLGAGAARAALAAALRPLAKDWKWPGPPVRSRARQLTFVGQAHASKDCLLARPCTDAGGHRESVAAGGFPTDQHDRLAPEDAGHREGLTHLGLQATAAPWAPLVLRADKHHTRLSCDASPKRLVANRHSTCRCPAGATPRSAISARSHPINGLRTASAGNREKSRSADHNSATPCDRQMAAMRAS